MSHRRLPVALLVGALVFGGASSAHAQEDRPLVIGSKAFTEGRLLSEMLAQLVEENTNIRVERRIGLGGTHVCFEAVRTGEIDLYVEYTGTGLVSILKGPPQATPLDTYAYVRREFLARYELEWLGPLGFNNTYALAMPEAKAEGLGIRTISDLARRTNDVKIGLSLEFLKRADGWPGLQRAYGFEGADVRGMEHGLAYTAVASGRIDVIDAYSTDGKLLRYELRVLEDDKGVFPRYHAAPVVRSDALRRFPELRPVLERLAARIPARRMQQLNYRVEEEKQPFEKVAREFLGEVRAEEDEEASARKRGFVALFQERWDETLELTLDHLGLTLIAVLFAVLASMPLGVLCARVPKLVQPVLGGAGVIQTIPSLALLAFMIPIPFLGLGATSAIVALFLYALLPIIRNTYTGIHGVEPDLIEAARGMGLTDGEILRLVQLPLAMRTIMAGVRTATVISVGVATLAAFVGAGGLGEPIITGLQLNDTNLILCGAIPAALLAVAVDGLLGGVERLLVPRGLEGAA